MTTLIFFSKRRRDIDAFLQSRGMDGARAAAMATLATRSNKESPDRDALHSLWQANAKTAFDALIQQSKQLHITATDDEVTKSAARDAVNYAIEHLSEKKSLIDEIELLNTALMAALGDDVNIEHIVDAIDTIKKQKGLIPLVNPSGQLHFTTPTLLKYEQQVLQHISDGKQTCTPITPLQKINGYLIQQFELPDPAKDALKRLFGSTDQIMGLDCRGAKSKTSCFQVINDLAKLGKHKVIGLGINALSTTQFKKDAGFKRVETVSGFIHRIHRQQNQYHTVDGKKVIIVISDAQMLGSHDRYQLTDIVRKTGSRLIFQFDRQAPHALSVGSSMEQLVEHGLLCPTIENQLDKRKQQLSKPTQKATEYSFETAFKRLKNNIVAIEDEHERFVAMAQRYVSVADEKQSQACVLMASAAQANTVNQLIHEKRRESLQQNPMAKLTVLLPNYLTPVQFRLAKNYKVGQWIRFNENYKSLHIQRGDYVKIERLYTRDNTIVLKNERGKTIFWKPHVVAGKKQGAIEVFNEVTREMMIGERVIIHRSTKSKNLARGQLFTVQVIRGHRIHLLDDNGQSIRLNMKHHEARHVDYGYAQALHRHMNVTNQDLIVHQSSIARTTSKRHFYQFASQSQNNVTIYTDDYARYCQKMQCKKDHRISVISEILKSAKRFAPDQPFDITSSTGLLNQYLNNAIAILIQRVSHQNKTKDVTEVAKEAIHYAMANCAEREAAFTHKEIIETALKYVLGETNLERIEKAVLHAEKNQLLLRGQYVSDGTKWTTPSALERERFILDFAKKGRGKQKPIAQLQDVQHCLYQQDVSEEQKAAATLIATSTDTVILIQGAPGTGKTTLLRATHAFLAQKESEVQYLAPTHSAVNELNKAGLNAVTVQRYLADFRKTQSTGTSGSGSNTLFVLDESSFVSNRQAKEFFQMIECQGGRCVLVGDHQQLSAIEAGKPSTLLEWDGVKTAYMNDIRRQKNAALLSAVKAAYAGNFRKCFHLLENRFIDDKSLLDQARSEAKHAGIPFDPENTDRKILRLNAVKDQFFTQFDQTGQMPLVITLTNNDRRAINTLIRDNLIDQGQLHQNALTATILEPLHFTEVDRAHVMTYKAGQILRFNLNQRHMNVKAGEYLTVTDVKKSLNLVMLKKANGERVLWRPLSYQEEQISSVEVYMKSTRELSQGDRIRWTRSDPDNHQMGGTTATIVSIHHPHAQVKTDDGQRITIKLLDPSNQHWDHAYAATTYFAQGKTDDKPIVFLESTQINLANQANFLVAISRAKMQATIVTDDPNKLLKQVLKNTGEKLSAMEVMGEISAPKGNAAITSPHQKIKKTPIKGHAEKQPTLYWQANTLSQKLSDHIESVLEQVLGKPQSKTTQQYRFGSNKGSLFVTIHGDKRGWWKDFQTDEGGRSLLSLIQRETGLGFKDTLDYAASLLGLSDHDKAMQNSSLLKPKIKKSKTK